MRQQGSHHQRRDPEAKVLERIAMAGDLGDGEAR